MTRISSFSERLREGLNSSGMKPSELSAITGISKSSISHYLKGDWEGKQDAVLFISKALNVSEAWLMGYDVPKERKTQPTNSDNITELNITNIIPLPKTKKVPLIGTIACGEPILADENIESFINMPEEVGATFALKCKGDSMINARIFDGDIVYIREQPDVENGEIAAVLIGDEATLKKIYKYPNRIELRAENPTMKPLEFEGEAINSIRILGKAVYFISHIV